MVLFCALQKIQWEENLSSVCLNGTMRPKTRLNWLSDRSYSLKLKTFQKFDSAATAVEEVASIIEGKVSARLAGLLDSIKDEKKVSLAVADPKLGKNIHSKLVL